MRRRATNQYKNLKYLVYFLLMVAFWTMLLCGPMVANGKTAPPNSARSKFYDFSEQLIDGEIKKPTALYTDARARAKFERLLRLKRSFMRELFNTAKEKVFK